MVSSIVITRKPYDIGNKSDLINIYHYYPSPKASLCLFHQQIRRSRSRAYKDIGMTAICLHIRKEENEKNPPKKTFAFVSQMYI